VLSVTPRYGLSDDARVLVVENHYRRRGKAYMRMNGKAAFRRLQKEPWLGLMIALLGVALIVLSWEV